MTNPDSQSDERNKSQIPEFDAAEKKIPAGRSGTEKDVGGTLMYLVSRSGAYTNGQVRLWQIICFHNLS